MSDNEKDVLPVSDEHLSSMMDYFDNIVPDILEEVGVEELAVTLFIRDTAGTYRPFILSCEDLSTPEDVSSVVDAIRVSLERAAESSKHSTDIVRMLQAMFGEGNNQ